MEKNEKILETTFKSIQRLSKKIDKQIDYEKEFKYDSEEFLKILELFRISETLKFLTLVYNAGQFDEFYEHLQLYNILREEKIRRKQALFN